ncbi:MAG: hypothetical protein CMM56_03175 [Rhodospirillaceae bacterium]|nr:hypothetical protein [Rhodospirillaceae bacterium]|tara:strand:- start:2778 stop:3923 length:1146 start_codon:yes stop_codon:yes gene_type:complete
MISKNYDVVVVGSGVFGIWSAYKLHAAGKRVAVVDFENPAHHLSSSGGESRVTRCSYGDVETYTEWASRSISDWQALSAKTRIPVFHQVGVLRIHKKNDESVMASTRMLERYEIPFTVLSPSELREQFPVMQVRDDEAGFFEPQGGALMAKRSVQLLAANLAQSGVVFISGLVLPIQQQQGYKGSLPSVTTVDGDRIDAEQFVIACGPWLDQVCPDAMAGRLFVTRQEVFFFDTNVNATGALPVWSDLPFYGFPSFEGRGFKIANDTHGCFVDPNTMDRNASNEGEADVRAYLRDRFPAFANAPLSETRVCQYENSSDGHFLMDRHPGFDNVWLVGCGSGHGFKHGPAVGNHVVDLINGTKEPLELFLLESKRLQQDRIVL